MRQGWIGLALAACVTFACVATALEGDAHAASKRASAASASASKAKDSLRQFTGYVTAQDKQSLTVEKRGKKPQTRTFTKHAEMKATGDVEKNARVTVYYRDDGDDAVAHRVVVKPTGEGSKSQR